MLLGQVKAWAPATQVQNWPSTRTPAGGPEGRDPKSARGSGGECLAFAAANWPTPEVRNYRSGKRTAESKRRENKLEEVIVNFPTFRPDATSILKPLAGLFARLPTTTRRRRWRLLLGVVRHNYGEIGALLRVWTPPECPRLNPAFHWWLMGWPHPGTFFGSAATESSTDRQPSLFSTCSAV